MLEFSYNKTMDWLKSQGEERERALVTLAQQSVVYEVREEAERLLRQSQSLAPNTLSVLSLCG